ncbi:MAG: lyase family protein, partial [Selenomonadaceae bacterium]|nr:lyase family protein [Selenomonadaceae bacterium]
MRMEHDFLGEMEIPDDVYYGVQTMRAMDNFHITGQTIIPEFVQALAMVKKAAALANMETGRLDPKIGNALVQACDEILAGKMLDQFPVDPIQGGAGTSVNMNINEVISNRALEILGHPKGRYDIVSPNNHANMAQSTNDAFPTGVKVCINTLSHPLLAALNRLATHLEDKGEEYADILKMGRTHLQDAIPVTLGQEMTAYASAIRRGMNRIGRAVDGTRSINMGATAIGTGLNAEPTYIVAVARHLCNVTGDHYRTAP